jgi:hypothetical protein
MKLTIDNLDGLGETDYTARLDAEAPPKIVRKLNQAPLLTARLACEGVGITAAAGSKVRLYRDTGDLWFSGYMDEAPQREFAGMLMGTAVFRVALHAKGEMGALDRGVLSERAAMGGRTAGQAVTVLTQEANSAFTTAAVQDVALSASYAVETGELWSAATAGIADCARATLSVQSRALTMAPVGLATRTLTDGDAGFSPDSLKLSLGGATANDITVIGSQEPALYVRDHFTATGSEVTLALTQDAFKAKRSVLVEDDFHTMALDMTKWKNDFPGPLTFTQGGVACAGPVALRYRDRVEVGGLIILEQTGISYTNGQGIVGGLFCGGVGPNYCIAGVMLENGQVQPVIGGVVNAAVKQLTAGMLYEFRTLIFHPEPIRAGQVYSSSVCNGQGARTSQVWSGTTHIVMTMREINPADPSTLSSPQVVIFDCTMANVQAYADYLPLWGLSLTCTLGHAAAINEGAVWVQSAAPGQAWRTRVMGDVSAGAECYVTAKELHFTAASEPVLNEQIEVFYRTSALACGRVVDPQSIQALKNTEDSGTRAMVAHVTAPAPRTSLDCEQAARALLDDLTQVGCNVEYQAWAGMLPAGPSDVQPGELWNISAALWGVNCLAVVREVEIEFQDLSDQYARFALRLANDAAKPIGLRFARAKHNALVAVVASNLQDDVSARPAGLPDARITTVGTPTLTLDTGIDPIPGGGFEVRVEGDWGWGMTINQNLVGRYTSRSISLPSTGVTQTFYLRQFDASTPPQYSTYATVLNVEV